MAGLLPGSLSSSYSLSSHVLPKDVTQKRIKASSLGEHRRRDDLWVLGAVLATSAVAGIGHPRQEENPFWLMVSEGKETCIFLTT